MRIRSLAALLAPLLLLALVQPGPATAGSRTPAASTAPELPTLVDVRADHRRGADRLVFEFEGGLPDTEVDYVRRLYADGSGRRVWVPGRAIVSVLFRGARAHDDQGTPTSGPRHRALSLPNVMAAIRSGDFEGDVGFGLGVARRTPVRVSTRTSPSRVVVRIGARFPTVQRKVFLLDVERFEEGVEPYFRAVRRPVPADTPATGVLDRLFAGPLASERAAGLRLLRSRARTWADLEIRNGVARVRLLGGCSSGGSTVSIAGEIMPTLRQFPSVDWIKVFDPQGRTADPTGTGDSIPACLEP